jgi:hypothetical protein
MAGMRSFAPSGRLTLFIAAPRRAQHYPDRFAAFHRVFVSDVANPASTHSVYLFMRDIAAEEVFRVERRPHGWIVTHHETLMIT